MRYLIIILLLVSCGKDTERTCESLSETRTKCEAKMYKDGYGIMGHDWIEEQCENKHLVGECH